MGRIFIVDEPFDEPVDENLDKDLVDVERKLIRREAQLFDDRYGYTFVHSTYIPIPKAR